MSILRPCERELKPVCSVWYWPREVPVDRDSGGLTWRDGLSLPILQTCLPVTLGVGSGAWALPPVLPGP